MGRLETYHSPVRLFTAIDIPEDILATLADLLRQLKPLARFKWSPPENLHITTKFIGEWAASDYTQLAKVLEAVPRPGPIDIAVQGIGWFPNPHHPRAFFAAIQAPKELADLAAATAESVEAIGVEKDERRYTPHLTLARIRETDGLADVRKAVANLPSTNFGRFTARSFWLYESDRSKYTKLEEFPLL